MLAQLDDLKTLVGVPLTDSSQDGLLALCLGAADAAVKSYCKRTFESATVTEYHSGSGKPELVLRQRPVTAISHVYFDMRGYFGKGPSAFAAGTELTEGVDFVLKYDEGSAGDQSRSGLLLRLAGGGSQTDWTNWPNDWARGTLAASLLPFWAKGTGNIKVVCVSGFTTIPADLAQAVLQLGAWTWNNSPRGGIPLQSERFEQYGMSLALTALQGEPELGTTRSLLRRYRETVCF